MELATSLNVFDRSISREEAVRRCAAAGFRALDGNYWDYQKQLLEQAWPEEEAWLHAIRAAADEAGARFLQTHGTVFDLTPDGTAYQMALAYGERALRAAAILGTEGSIWVVCHPHTLPGTPDAAHRRATRERNVAYFRALLPVAERLGVGIALENMNDRGPGAAAPGGVRRRYCATPDELVDLVDAFDHPLVGACWDTGHAHLQALDQGAALRALGSRLKATHIHDNDGLSDQHLLPLYGKVDWPRLVAALREIGYSGAFTYETHSSLRILPDALRDAGLRFALALGRYLLDGAPAG